MKYIGKIASKKYTNNENAYSMMDKYIDYVRVRENANKYNEIMKQRNEENGIYIETFYYDEFPKVSALSFLHNKAVRDYNYYEKIESEEKLKNQDKKILEFTTSKEYQKFVYNDNVFSIITPLTTQDLLDEGYYLSHCVGTYAGRVANKQSYIFFLRENKQLNVPFYTIEVNKIDKEYILSQCYTFHDTINKTKECKDFILKWCQEKHIKINCSL
jgi:hypothetical protein